MEDEPSVRKPDSFTAAWFQQARIGNGQSPAEIAKQIQKREEDEVFMRETGIQMPLTRLKRIAQKIMSLLERC